MAKRVDSQGENVPQTDTLPSLILGLNWWGINPYQMAESLTNTKTSPTYTLSTWDITRRKDRLIMSTPLADHLSHRRVKRYLSELDSSNNVKEFSWVSIYSPHRVSTPALALLRGRTKKMIAFFGDRPLAARRITAESIAHFDSLSVPDPTWFDDLPHGDYRQDISIWGSILDPRIVGQYAAYRPEGFAVVGTPYPERQEIVKQIEELGQTVTAIGSGWKGLVAGCVHRSRSVASTIELLRQKKLAVLNIHHRQFVKGLNPQFCDYAVAAIPQVVTAGRATGTELGSIFDSEIENLIVKNPDLNEFSGVERVNKLAGFARKNLYYNQTVERVLR